MLFMRLWRPQPDDPAVFLAVAFVWGVASSAWDFIALRECVLYYNSNAPINALPLLLRWMVHPSMGRGLFLPPSPSVGARWYIAEL